MLEKKDIGVNGLLNMVRSGLSVLFPLFTYPYALRVLQAEGIGKVSYSSTVLGYFSLIAALGSTAYAVREGAKVKDDRSRAAELASQIYTIQIIASIISYLLLFLTVSTIKSLRGYAAFLAVQSLTIILTAWGMEWVGTVYEDLGCLTIQSVVAHLTTSILLFLLVRTKEDQLAYASLPVIAQGIVSIMHRIYIRRYMKVRFTFTSELKKHVRPLLLLFADQIAISVYVNADITILGAMKGDRCVGLYTVSVRIYMIVKRMLSSAYTAAIPRMAYYTGNGMADQRKKLYTDLWGCISLLLLPACTGLFCIADELMLLMGGGGYLEGSTSLKILSAAALPAIWGGLVTAVLNVTLGREGENLKATLMGAVLNIGLDLLLIPAFAHDGAAFATFLSEAFVFFACGVRIPEKGRYVDLSVLSQTLRHGMFGSVLIALYSYILERSIQNVPWRFFFTIGGSILLYGAALSVVKDRYFLEGIKKISWRRGNGGTHDQNRLLSVKK